MKKYYIIINKIHSNIKGYYVTTNWTFKEILDQVQEGEQLKEIHEHVWMKITENNMSIKEDIIEQFLADTSDFEVDKYFKESIVFTIDSCISQEQKDIKLLAEFNKTLIEAMLLPSECEPNPMLAKMQEIIDRYS